MPSRIENTYSFIQLIFFLQRSHPQQNFFSTPHYGFQTPSHELQHHAMISTTTPGRVTSRHALYLLNKQVYDILGRILMYFHLLPHFNRPHMAAKAFQPQINISQLQSRCWTPHCQNLYKHAYLNKTNFQIKTNNTITSLINNLNFRSARFLT